MNQSQFSSLTLRDQVNGLLDVVTQLKAGLSDRDELLVANGAIQGAPVCIAAQNSEVAGGTLGAVQTQALLDLCERILEEKPKALVLLLESGGVRLHEGNRGMAGLARVMQRMLAIRRAGVVTIAVIGGRFGCWGGATLISGVCDKVLMVDAARYGLSGPKVLQLMAEVRKQIVNREDVAPFLTAQHRLSTGEIDKNIVDDVAVIREAIARAIAGGTTDLLSRARHALEQSETRMRGVQLPTHSISEALPGVTLSGQTDTSWQLAFDTTRFNTQVPGVVCGTGRLDERDIPFFGCTLDTAMGPEQGLVLLRCVLQASRGGPSCILLLADAVQAFDLANERYGYGQVLSALAQVLGHTAATICPVIGWLRSAGSGASMVALSMCGVSLYAHRDAQIHPLPPNVVAGFVADKALADIDASPSPENFQRLGVVQEVWGDDYVTRLQEVLRAPGVASSR